MGNVAFFEDQYAFVDWFESTPKAMELWVGFYKKSSGKQGISWSESVDVALCYGNCADLWHVGLANNVQPGGLLHKGERR